jgi:hypothetical protein
MRQIPPPFHVQIFQCDSDLQSTDGSEASVNGSLAGLNVSTYLMTVTTRLWNISQLSFTLAIRNGTGTGTLAGLGCLNTGTLAELGKPFVGFVSFHSSSIFVLLIST